MTQAVVPQMQYSLSTTIDASALSNGMHRIHLRFKEVGGIWSSVTSSFFQKIGNSTSLVNLLSSYRYWVDSLTAPITTIHLPSAVNPYELIQNMDMTNIPQGNHVLNIQFKDTYVFWNVILGEAFIKNPLPIAAFSAQSTLL